ncbi:MAG: hypothetical protein EOP10_28790, partial [Proteobacteria bacterium]
MARTLFKSLSVLPVALTLLAGLSCSQPPAMVSSNKIGASKDAKPDVKDQVEDDDQKSSDDEDMADKEDEKVEDKDADKDKEDDKVPDPVVMEPAKEPEKSKFVPCVDQTDKCHPHVFVMADEPLHKILLVNLDDPSKDWDLDVPGGARDLQLIGDNKVLVGTLDGPGGYHEVDLTTGKILKSVTGFGGVQAVQRLANGNTLVMGSGLDGGRGMVVLEVDGNKKILSKKEFPNVRDGRMVRQTKAGTFLM